jgi:hypothetical protein
MSAMDDERPTAVVRSEDGADAWRAAVHAQQSAAPDHTDFYAIAGDVVATLHALDALAGVFGRQTCGYADGREVYDDEDANPAHRLRCAVLALAETRHALAQAERAANRFWSAIGHIGVRHHDAEGGRS